MKVEGFFKNLSIMYQAKLRHVSNYSNIRSRQYNFKSQRECE